MCVLEAIGVHRSHKHYTGLQLSGSIGVISIIRVHSIPTAYIITHRSNTGSPEPLFRFTTPEGISGAICGLMSHIFEIRCFQRKRTSPMASHAAMHDTVHPCIHSTIHPSIHPCESIQPVVHPSIRPSIHASMHTVSHASPYVYSDLSHIM